MMLLKPKVKKLSFLFFIIILILFIPSYHPVNYKDSGYVYQKDIEITVKDGKESRVYVLSLYDPDNKEDRGECIVDSYTYSIYPLCSDYSKGK